MKKTELILLPIFSYFWEVLSSATPDQRTLLRIWSNIIPKGVNLMGKGSLLLISRFPVYMIEGQRDY